MVKYAIFTEIFLKMKNLLLMILLFAGITVFSQTVQKKQVVEVACGQCQFKMKGKKGCDLAVRMGGKSYFVEGTHIDDHGDAHSEEGFCNAVRKAEVTGTIKADKFVATSFKLLPKGK